jgi:hypothetical protein
MSKSNSAIPVAAAVMIVVGAIVVGIGQTLFSGLVLKILWGWFVAPVFGIAALTIPAALGLTVTVNLLLAGKANLREEERKGVWLLPALALALGYVVHLFM